MSSAGVLSGTAGRRAVAGQTSVTVQVTETVTTLNGTRTVKTKHYGPGDDPAHRPGRSRVSERVPHWCRSVAGSEPEHS